MRIVAATVTFALFAALCACKDNEPTSTTPSATASVVASAPPAASSAAPVGSVAASAHMAHCPSSVTGAKTDVKDVEGGVELTITANDPQAVADIRARTKALLDAAAKQSPTAHTGGGGGGGLAGRCPVVLKNTTLASADVDKGTKITVKAKSAGDVASLRDDTRVRIADLGKPAQEGAGEGKMAHCPSAVDGATTKIDTTGKDAVVVTVVAKDTKNKATVDEIRARAKHVLDASKADGGAVKHTGTGTGADSGLGRCPVVLDDTTLTVKDVDGGSQFTVKPTKADGLKALQDETKERSARFMLAAPAASASAAH